MISTLHFFMFGIRFMNSVNELAESLAGQYDLFCLTHWPQCIYFLYNLSDCIGFIVCYTITIGAAMYANQWASQSI